MAKKPKPVPALPNQLPDDVTLEDFYAFMPSHEYLFVPNGDLWPAGSINDRLGKVPLINFDGTPVLDKKGNPKSINASTWLGKNRPIEQMTWAPGEELLIHDKLAVEGGWIARRGVATFNMYKPPARVDAVGPPDVWKWLDLVDYVYPDHVEHIVRFLAHRIQRPWEKINHALALAGSPGIGKDTMLEPLKRGVGEWNFKEVSPASVMSVNNGYMRATVVRVSEMRDLGDVNRFQLYEKTKTLIAAPPDMVEINIKFVPQHYIPNVPAFIVTTNHGADGLYLPPDDRRHYVCGTAAKKEDYREEFWTEIWDWYNDGGIDQVISYLERYDLSGFDAKRPPEKTAAFWRMADAGTASEVPELRDALDQLGTSTVDANGNTVVVQPVVTTVDKVLSAVRSGDLHDWLKDRKNRRSVPHRFESCGYLPVRNNGRDDGLWSIAGKRQVVYGRQDVGLDERYKAAEALKAIEDKKLADALEKLKGNVLPFNKTST